MDTKHNFNLSKNHLTARQLNDGQCLAWLSLARDTRFSVMQKHQLLQIFTDPVEIYQVQYRELCASLGIKVNAKREQIFQMNLQHGLEKDMHWLQHSNNHLVCWGQLHYPKLLTEISDPPVCLFASGSLSYLAEPKVSIVGSRRPTPVGAKITNLMASDLAKLGIVICSGMALGVDGISHQAALNVGEPTIAVMGCGLDIISPARHRQLFEQITSNGLALSEYPLAYPASKYTFPQRNRIVSGLSYGVVIVEAADKSGTIITARLAMEQNREVFVVPGSPVNPQYCGSHRLIRQGATLIIDADDVLSELSGVLHREHLSGNSNKADSDILQKNSTLHEAENPLLAHIGYEASTIDQIILRSGLTVSEVSSMLLILEIKGLVATTEEGSYLRIG